ncbi:MAG: YihY/virulence factor BrkB family protein [Acidimicrobiales bacterium]
MPPIEPRPKRAGLRELGLSGWRSVVARSLVRSARDRLTMNAASLAFHWFLAMPPTALALLGAASLVGIAPGELRLVVRDVGLLLPAEAARVVDLALHTPLSKRQSIAAVAAGGAIALWSAVESMSALEVALDVAYEVDRDRGWLAKRLLAVPLVALTIVLGGAAFALLVLGKPLGELLAGTLPVAAAEVTALWDVIRFGGALALVIVLLSAYYAFGPNRRSMWDWLSPGSAIATVSWVLLSVGFSVYLASFGHESRTYGTFAGVAVLLLWLFLSGCAVLVGAELNRELERVLEAGPARTGGPARDQQQR